MAAKSQSETQQRRSSDRYEFRVWGDDLLPLFIRLREAGNASDPEESSEVYVVSRYQSVFNPKVREGRLDVKELIETHKRLELWHPYLKAQFPLRLYAEQQSVSQVLSLSQPIDWEAIDTAEAFLRDIVEPCPHLVLVPVRKTRTRFSLGSCSAEFVAVVAGKLERETVCVESDNAAAALRVVARLGLGGQENCNYQRALRAMLGIDGMTRTDFPA